MNTAWRLSTGSILCAALCTAALVSGGAWADEADGAKVAPEVVNITGARVASTGKECIYMNLASLRLKSVDGLLTARGDINGKDESMIIDTGRLHSLLTLDEAKRLSLSLAHANAESKVSYAVYVDDVALDKYFWHKLVLGVVDDTPAPPYGLRAGADILLNGLNKDVELSVPEGQMKIFVPSNCEDAFLGYWNKDASTVALVDLSTADPRQILTVRINGKEMTAMIDTGSPISMITLKAAERAGVTPASEGVSELQSGFVPGRQNGKVWHASFNTFSVGNEVIQHPDIAIADIWGTPEAPKGDSLASMRLIGLAPTMVGAKDFRAEPSTEGVTSVTRVNTQATAPVVQPDMLLGADFLRSHRVLLAISQRKMYFTYVGGKVFGNVGEKKTTTAPLGAVTQPLASLSATMYQPEN